MQFSLITRTFDPPRLKINFFEAEYCSDSYSIKLTFVKL